MAYLTQRKAEKLLRDLQIDQGEKSNIDCKEILHLKENGDKATFIRHIAALANTGLVGYLIIGVENQTWNLKGIPDDSPLLDVDKTQQQMNQILSNRVDPALNITYQIFRINEVRLGFVGVDGKNPLYIISITDDKYGGGKSKGTQSYIQKGAIYIRRGSNSVIADRQSDVLDIVDARVDYLGFLFALVFLAMIVAAGVGLGVSFISFQDSGSAILFACVWGIVVGWLLNSKIVENARKYSASLVSRIFRHIIGPFWGAFIAILLTINLARAIIEGNFVPPDPISMGMITTIVVVILILPAFLFLIISDMLSTPTKRLIRWLIERLKKKFASSHKEVV